MTKYYITDLSMGYDRTKELTREEFYESIEFNIEQAVEYEEMTIQEGLDIIKELVEDENEKLRFTSNVEVNGFIYELAKI